MAVTASAHCSKFWPPIRPEEALTVTATEGTPRLQGGGGTAKGSSACGRSGRLETKEKIVKILE